MLLVIKYSRLLLLFIFIQIEDDRHGEAANFPSSTLTEKAESNFLVLQLCTLNVTK